MFSAAAPPKRSGDYTRFVTKRATTLPATTGSIVAVPFVDDWGPLREFVLLDSFAEYLAVFGAPIDIANPSQGYIGVYNAFKGGAGQVLAYRHAGSAAAKADIDLAAGGGTGITLTAKYEGVRGQELKVAVVVNALSGTARDVQIFLGTTKVEEYKGYTASTITDLEDVINSTSVYVDASAGANGTVLTALTATALSGGNSGNTLLSADWVATETAYEPQRFGYFVPANLTDSSITTSLTTWAKNLNAQEKAKRFFLVTGGAAGETYSTAATRASGANDENVVTLGIGTYHDVTLDMDVSTAQLAPRLAGTMSARGGRSAISFAYFDDIEIVSGPSDSEILASTEDGIVVLALGTAGVRLEKGVTTYTSDSDDKPFSVYSKIKWVTTMQSFEREGREANEDGTFLGLATVNDDTREALVAREQGRLDNYILNKEVQPGAKVYISSDPAPSDDDEFIAVDWVGKFTRTAEQVRRSIIYS